MSGEAVAAADAAHDLAVNYADLIYGACLRVLGNHHDAEDAAQEAMLRVLRSDRGDVANLAGWIHTVAVRCAQDLIRTNQRGRARDRRAELVPSSPPDQSEAAAIIEALDHALLDLPEADAELIRAHYLMGVSQAEIAEAEGVSSPAIAKRMRQALERLRRSLRRGGVVAGLLLVVGGLEAAGAQVAPHATREQLSRLALGQSVGAVAGASGFTSGGLSGWLTGGIAALGCALVGALVVWSAQRPAVPYPGQNKAEQASVVDQHVGIGPALIDLEPAPERDQDQDQRVGLPKRDHRRAGDGALIPESIVFESDFSSLPVGWSSWTAGEAHRRGITLGESTTSLEVGAQGLRLPGGQALRAHNLLAGDFYRLRLEASVSPGAYFNIFGLPISPVTPWEPVYENMQVSHILPRDRFVIEVECARLGADFWDVSYALDGVPMHRGRYRLDNANDVILYSLDMRVDLHRLAIWECRRSPLGRASATSDQATGVVDDVGLDAF